MRMMNVATSSPMKPVVRSAKRIEMAELMTVLPSSRVQSNRLPCSRTAADSTVKVTALREVLVTTTANPIRGVGTPASLKQGRTDSIAILASSMLSSTMLMLSIARFTGRLAQLFPDLA